MFQSVPFAAFFLCLFAGMLFFLIALILLKIYIRHSGQIESAEIKKAAMSYLLPVRLQAYERAVLFIERINPSNMLLRLHISGLSAHEMQKLLLSEVRSEFQHNVTQQLYMTETAWAILVKVKDETIMLMNECYARLNAESGGAELSKSILTTMSGSKDIYEAALSIIKKDISNFF